MIEIKPTKIYAIYTWKDGTQEPCVICGHSGDWLIIGLFTDKGCIQKFSHHVDVTYYPECKSYRFTKEKHLIYLK